DEPAQQAEEVADFARRPRPVLRAERENGEIKDAELMRRLHHAAQRLDAAAMAFRAWQATCCRPTPVAVHDDSNMQRTVDAVACCRNGGIRHRQILQTVRISFSFTASIWSISAIAPSVAFCTSLE